MEIRKKTHVRKSRYTSPKKQTILLEESLREQKKNSISKTAISGKSAESHYNHNKIITHRKEARKNETSAPRKSAKPYYNKIEIRPKSKFPVFWAYLCAGIFCVAIVAVAILQIKNKALLPTALAEQIGIDMDSSREETFVDMVPSKEINFSPTSVGTTSPENMISETAIEVDGTLLENITDYVPENNISFDVGEEYTKVDGIVTFRGNNFRDSAAYGNAEMENLTLTQKWSKTTGALSSGGTVWSGSGWTGQPLMNKWPREVKAHMNMYDWAKEDDDLVEVIYACMDGYVYFIDLESGEYTRDALYLGYTFKGSGALDPRGYPILYVGAGYNSNQGTAKVFVINLLDCSTLYTFGDNDPFSLRGSLSFFDSSPLVDAETDTLIYPGENGILYLIKLNTQYDQQAGTLSLSPGKTVKWRYYGKRSSAYSFWVGMEDSAAIYKGYLFIADNGGHLMCLDLNKLQLVWVQDVLDDSNSTPVLSIEDGHLYLYVSTSFRLGWRSSYSAVIPIWKIDAETGEIIWQTDYECFTNDGVSGGVQSTIASGKNSLSDYIYVTVSKTENNAVGVLACLDKKTGDVKWEHDAGYAWSSPVCVYRPDGTGKVLYCSSDGNMYLLDGGTGEVHDTYSLSQGVIEASPAVYNDRAVVGTRDCTIQCISLG